METTFALDVTRIGVLKRGSKNLVIDRLTGKSVYVDGTDESTLRLLASDPVTLPAQLRELREAAVLQLSSNGIGVGPAPRFASLNTLILKLTSACNFACTYCYDYEPDETAAHL